MKTNFFLLLFILFLYRYECYSQKDPIKFGKVELSDLEMKTYSLDTSASAVILCDYGYFNPMEFKFTKIIRIKILKKEGLNWANHVFPLSSKAEIRGFTYNLINNEIIKSKLKNESIFEEHVSGNRYLERVAMPNVEVGSIMDIEFNFFGIPSEWRFQEVIPVKYSELVIEPHNYLRYQKTFFGFQRLSISTDQRWVAENMPAIIEEPFISSIENYITKFEIDFLISVPGRFFGSYTESWYNFNNYLLGDEYFGNSLITASRLNEISEKIKEKCKTREEVLKAAHDSIIQIKWNGKKTFRASNTLQNKILKDGTGNSADINFLLLKLLQKLDFKVYPCVLSTRENGRMSEFCASFSKMNWVVLHTRLNNKEILVDATEEFAPYYLLPKRCLNGKARIVGKDTCEWIKIVPKQKDRSNIYFDLTLNEDLSLNGLIKYILFDYAALDFRNNYSKFNSKEAFIDDFLKTKRGLKLENLQIINLDSLAKPVQEEYKVSMNNAVIENGDEILINPFFFEQIKENPFVNEKRVYPIDFAYPIEKSYVTILRIPKNYQVSQIPSNTSFKLSDNSAKFQYSITQMENNLQITCKIMFDNSVYLMGIYAEIREFYNQIVKKHAEYIVLKKKSY